ncbi:restriction endonuclease [Tritonibacter scottomollicae]|uniref:Restriction endonuclease n=1 Tax=Tritonibacter scottomollicae TaxID=483013 RepID=A0ABZ0HJ66_TRISK|nr:restriction endonuclease [Tritonibacter scottomollicae]WOI34189.1 restriction endonuclease [Tritonibacter scottomollicae]
MARRGGGEFGLIILGIVVGVPIFVGQKILEGDLTTIAIVGGTVALIIGWKISSRRRGEQLAEEAQRQVLEVANRHKEALARLYRQKVYYGEYGELRLEAFDKAIRYFFENVLLPELDVSEDILQLPQFYQYVVAAVYSTAENTEIEGVCIDSIPEDPFEFEHWTAEVLNQHGWVAQATQGSGDQGSDVVAIFDSHKCIIQCKLYNGTVGNKAVQEVDAARTFFDGDSAVVVGKSGYTRSARQLAQKNKVLLVDVADLPKLADLLGLRNDSRGPVSSKEKEILNEYQTSLKKSKYLESLCRTQAPKEPKPERSKVRRDRLETGGRLEAERAKSTPPVGAPFRRETTVHLQNRDFIQRKPPEPKESEDEH